jgi:hypothetical protein
VNEDEEFVGSLTTCISIAFRCRFGFHHKSPAGSHPLLAGMDGHVQNVDLAHAIAAVAKASDDSCFH